jgi:hypothetical protein
MSFINSNNDNDIFPYGKYPANLRKLFEIAEKNPDSKESKLLQCMAWCKGIIPQYKGQAIMKICLASFEIKGKFFHEMNSRQEVLQAIVEVLKYNELN